MREWPTSTIVTVLDNALGGTSPSLAESLSLDRIDELAGYVTEYYESWQPPRDREVLTAYSGQSIGLTDDGRPDTGYLFGSLLYYPRILIHCPFGEWFTRDRSKVLIRGGPPLNPGQLWPDFGDLVFDGNDYFSQPRDLDALRIAVAMKLSIIDQLRDLIEEGVVVPVPQWRVVKDRQQSIATAMRFDRKDDAFYNLVRFEERKTQYPSIGDFMQGVLEPPRGMKASELRMLAVDAPSFYLNKVFSIADEFDAVYVPRSDPDYQLYRARLNRLRRELRPRSSLEYRIVCNLEKVALPLFPDIDPRSLIQARKNELAFDEFRQVLADLFINASAMPPDEAFPNQLSNYVQDRLRTRIRQVEAATSHSAVLREASREGGVQILLGGASVGAAAMTGSAWAAAAVAAGSTGLVEVLRRLVFRRKASGGNLVISALLQR